MIESIEQEIPKSKKSKEESSSKKLSPEGLKLLISIRNKANKKAFGSRVRNSQILDKALSLIKPEHIEELQNESVTDRNRWESQYQEYQKQFGKISKDKYLSKLVLGEILPLKK